MVSGAEAYLRGQIELVLEDFARRMGGRVVHNVILDLGARTAGIDHLLIDRHGLLVVSVHARPSTTIRGGSGARTWHSRVGRDKPEPFHNPLADNASRVAMLKDAMKVCGRHIADEYFSDLVVFAGADISGLVLDPADCLKVVTHADLGAALQARHDFAINAGVIEPHEVDDLASLMRTLDRSDSPEVRLRLEGARKSGSSWWPFRRKAVTQVVVADEKAGLAPAAPRLVSDRYPDAQVVPLKRKPTAHVNPVLLLVLVLAIAAWLFFAGGLAVVQARVLQLSALAGVVQQQQPAPAVPMRTPAPGDPGLDSAKTVLRANAPGVYAQIKDPDSPEIIVSDKFVSYTWHYVPKKGATAGTQQWIALTFDSAGVLVGVDAP